jgi:hypothetical protein
MQTVRKKLLLTFFNFMVNFPQGKRASLAYCFTLLNLSQLFSAGQILKCLKLSIELLCQERQDRIVYVVATDSIPVFFLTW